VGIWGLETVKWGYIDKTGKTVINPQFYTATDFSEGLATVNTGSLCGYIDKTGTMVISPQFDAANDFSDGLARVWIRSENTGKTGYIDHTGAYVWEPTN
jgi:hypothetical protein